VQTHGIGPGGLGPQPAQPQTQRQVPAAPAQARDVPQQVVLPAAAPDAHGAEAPQGVDPALWAQLTPGERMFYLRSTALGPLTYQPRGSQQAAAPARGGRIDVRV
jgi:hypothetical protein